MNAVLTPAQSFFEVFGAFAKIPKFIRKKRLSPSAKAVFEVLLELMDSSGLVYIYREKIKAETGLSIFTISKAVTELEKSGLLVRTGKFKNKLFPYVQILKPSLEEKKPRLSQVSSTCGQTATGVCSNRHTQLRIKQIKIKQTAQPQLQPLEQKALDVCSQILKDQSSDHLLARKSLTTHGVHKDQARRLVVKHSPQTIMDQVAHLKYLQQRGDKIHNPAGWLIRSLTQNYTAPKELKERAEAKADEEQRQRIRQAEIALERAENLVRKENLAAAKEALEESLRVHPLSEAKKLLQSVLKRIEEKNLICELKNKTSQSQQEILIEEAKKEKREELRRNGFTHLIPESSAAFLGSVKTIFEQKLLALYSAAA